MFEKRIDMVNINISNAKSELYKLAFSCIKNNDVINIATRDGNVVMMSADNYNNLIESLYLAGIKNVYEDSKEVVKTPTSKFIKDPPWK